MTNKLTKINISSRLGLAFVFFYHGFFPKILQLSAIEKELVDLHNLPIASEILSPLAGILEIALAIAIITLRKSLLPVYIAAVALTILLIDVALIKPELLTEAFNPVTINIASLFLCYITFISQNQTVPKSNREAQTRAD